MNDELSVESVQVFLRETELGLKPTQGKLFLKKIKQFCRKLDNGEMPPPISVDNNAIIEGHHRYISCSLLGIDPEQCPGVRPRANEITSWDLVEVVNS